MKALTLTQPWATLVAIGAKRFETRSWTTKYRGSLMIHAAKGFPVKVQHLCFSEPFRLYLGDYIDFGVPFLGNHRFPLGYVIATCDLVDIIRIGDIQEHYFYPVNGVGHFSVPPEEPELSFGNYSPGRYAWILANVKQLKEPEVARGALGLWDVNKR